MFKKLYIKTYGCQMNVYDSQKIADLLAASHKFILTNNVAEADLILLNTCSVRDKAEEKVFSDLGRFRLHKNKRPEIIIGVGGCVAMQERENILKRAPFVDIIFGPQTLHELPLFYDEVLNKQTKVIDTRFLKNEKFAYFPPATTKEAAAFVTIMEGCNYFCSYCIVPQTRGREISRPMPQILQECQYLAQQDVKEIHFLGQNVNAYLDNQDGSAKPKDLADLLENTGKIEGIKRIRFTTSHPSAFSERLINAYAKLPKLVSHLHLPIQSGSDKILKAMNRKYTAAVYTSIIKKLRHARPNLAISSDFIVGFPGETEEDFLATLKLVEDIKFDHSFSFIYSPRPNTKAALLEDKIPLAVKKERLFALQQLLDNQEKAINEAMLNTKQKILVTGLARKNSKQLSGRTENNRVVNFIGEKDLIGKIIEVKIDEILRNSLRGTITEKL